ncbi:hypothetical protein [Microbacterium sp. GCS4]|uniref:hypothetical protein n=1 Tax=Microbacterium sp. GCS4 TaxID=1692239 RepID=UPI0006816ADF|nr:hypothetical protein [Microbacterium sp. GCS4]KNY07923.1 hypothetical protein AKH00_06815 [Microbacterium sp. GCS4]
MPGPESTSPIRLDESKSLIVIYCTEHDWYRASRFHRDEALDAACDHEEREHPGDQRHREARRLRKTYRRVAVAKRPASYEPGSKV